MSTDTPGFTRDPDRKSIEEIVEEHRDVFETIANAEELPEDFRERYGRRPLRKGGVL